MYPRFMRSSTLSLCRRTIIVVLAQIMLSVSLVAQNDTKATFRWTTCPDCPYPQADTNTLKQEKIAFGYLTVPENRQKDRGRKLRIAVQVFRKHDTASRKSPMIILHGGPGGKAIGNLLWQYEILRKERDIVLVDQRGSGFSEPEFTPELNQQILDVFAKDLTPAQEIAERTSIALAAKQRLINKGIDLSAYNSHEIAADIHDLCALLGYSSYNLWGGSYGTRVGLSMIKYFPEGINSVILESTLPPNARYFEEITANFKESMNLLFERCAADNACNLAYPNLKEQFYTAIDGLQKAPIVIPMEDRARFPDGKFVINAQDMLLGFQQTMYNKEMYPIMPFLIKLVRERNAPALKSFVEGMTNGVFRLNYGLYYTVICNECMPFNNLQVFDSTAAGFWEGLTFYKDEFSICRQWDPGPGNARDSAAAKSDIPVLLLSGEFDPIAAPSYASLTKATLPNAYLYTFQNTGHFVVNDVKTMDMVQQFLNDPLKEPSRTPYIATGNIPFITNIHVNMGTASLAPKLSINLRNAYYTGWLVLILISLLLSLFFAVQNAARKTLGQGLSVTGKICHSIIILNAVLGLYFLIKLIMVIAETASVSYLTLGFGLPGRYALLLVLPYFIIVLTAIMAMLALLDTRRNMSKGKMLLFTTLSLPFISLIWYFHLFY